jgi:hypothetical protein
MKRFSPGASAATNTLVPLDDVNEGGERGA